MKLLIVQTGFLGDVVLSTPVIAALSQQFPEAELHFLTTPAAADLISEHPEVSKTLVFDKRGRDRGFAGLRRMARRLKSVGYDAVFSLHKSYRTALLLRFAGIKNRYGFREASAPWLYTKTVERSDLPHEVLRNLAILRVLDIEPGSTEHKLHIELPPEAEAAAEALLGSLQAQTLVGIAPGSVWATKRWTTSGFAAVIRGLEQDGCRCVLLGSPEDASLGAEIEQLCGVPVLNLIGATSLVESAAVISRVSVLLSNDSAPLHIAAARGKPVAAVFCATVPEFGFGPWGVPHEILGVDGLACRPCGRHGGQSCPTGTHACQLGLSPEAVLAAVRRLMSAGSMHEEDTLLLKGVRNGE